MTNRTGDLRPDYTGYRDFLMAQPTRDLGDKHERIAESLLLNWLTHADPNILGLRESTRASTGEKLAMVHIAIPLDYSRAKPAAQGALGINQLADEQKTPRVNLIASSASNQPHSYIRVRAEFIVSQVLGD